MFIICYILAFYVHTSSIYVYIYYSSYLNVTCDKEHIELAMRNFVFNVMGRVRVVDCGL